MSWLWSLVEDTLGLDPLTGGAALVALIGLGAAKSAWDARRTRPEEPPA
jgi:hypothetical protein